jgi:hypothetical protein
MRPTFRLIVAALLAAVSATAQPKAHVRLAFDERLGPLHPDRLALGQGGLSPEPRWESRVSEIRALKPAVIRLFVQEYFDLLPERGRYHFETLDRSVDTILATGARPLLCICFKPRVLFSAINQDVVEPTDDAWGVFVFNLVRHYHERDAGLRSWEATNEVIPEEELEFCRR